MTNDHRLDDNLEINFVESWVTNEIFEEDETWDPTSLLNLELFLEAENMYDVLDILESIELEETLEL